jgi:hypothetical protein
MLTKEVACNCALVYLALELSMNGLVQHDSLPPASGPSTKRHVAAVGGAAAVALRAYPGLSRGTPHRYIRQEMLHSQK